MTALVEYTTRLVGKRHSVIHTHRQLRILLLENPTELDEVCASAQMAGLREVAVGEDMARTQVNEVGARSKLLGQFYYIIICTSRK